MDDLLNQPASQPQPRSDANPDVREQIESLRKLVISLMVVVLVLAATFDLYLLRQYKNTNAELNAVRPQAEAMISDFQKFRAPGMDNFLRQIVQYGQTHQDFGPILLKYQLKPQAAPVTPAPGVTSSAPAPKKL
jgi:uncharacterized protein HemX